jgi:hypothetical protein
MSGKGGLDGDDSRRSSRMRKRVSLAMKPLGIGSVNNDDSLVSGTLKVVWYMAYPME